MNRDDKLILKVLLRMAAYYGTGIILSISILFGVLYTIGWLAEWLAPKLPFWFVWAVFFTICVGMFIGSLASSPAAHQKHK